MLKGALKMMNELHTIVNCVHSNWGIIFGLYLLFYLLFVDKTKAVDNNKAQHSMGYKLLELSFVVYLILIILYWII